MVTVTYYVASSGSSWTTNCYYNDPNNNNSFYGRYSCSMDQMAEAINANSGYYISGTLFLDDGADKV